LTKQGVLPLTFVNESDYSKIGAGDVISTTGLDALLRGDLSAVIKVIAQKADGTTVEVETDHSLSKDQVEWIAAGSALNVIKAKAAAAESKA
jgi:homoaconitase